MSSKRILIACHCKELHGSLTSENVDYIDLSEECKKTENQITDWSDIPPESYDIIRSKGCPMYGFVKFSYNFNKNNTPYNTSVSSILEDSWRVLKYGGYFLLPIRNWPTTNIHYQYERAKQFIKKYYPNKWSVSLIDISSMPHHVVIERYDHAIAFQKIHVGSQNTTRKSRKYRKSRRRRQ
jgi:hypothetical protein